MKQKQKDKLADNLPACAVEFIKLVIKKMRYRKRVRQDVQAELAAHFEDELKGIKTEADREEKAKQLVGGFGDVKLLAVLLRRAKKRCRPLWQTVVARTFQTVGVLIVCFVIYVVWFLTGKPVITTNYVTELNRIVRPAADETQNAGPLYIKAAELYEKLPDETKELLSKQYKEVTSEQKQLIEKWLNENKETLELVISGTQRSYCWRKYGNERYPDVVMAILMPHLSDFRDLARALLWRAHLHAEQGRYEDAFGDIKCCYRFGQHLKGDKFLIGQLVGCAIEAFAVQTIRDILSEHQIDSAALATLQKDFEHMISGEDFAINLEAEKLFMYDEIQRCFTEDRFGGGHLYLRRVEEIGTFTVAGGINLFHFFSEKKNWAAPLHVLFTHPNKRESREMADRYYAFWDKIVQKTPAQIRSERIDTEKEAMEIIKGNLLLEILTPAISRVSEISYRNRADVEAALAIIAILRYKQYIGGYPDKLEKLINADYLKVLPIDPYSGRSLVYKKMDNNFVLYSFGPNFRDDDGKMAYNKEGKPRWRGTKEDGDMVFWPVPE